MDDKKKTILIPLHQIKHMRTQSQCFTTDEKNK